MLMESAAAVRMADIGPVMARGRKFECALAMVPSTASIAALPGAAI
jgi:hypothetical protein